VASVIVGGALANKLGHGGAAWTRMSWVRGLQRLGFDVVFVEQLSTGQCIDAHGSRAIVDASENLAYFNRVTGMFDLQDRAALVLDDGADVRGIDRCDLLDRVADADLLVNISGHLTWTELLRRSRRKAFVDLDPGFTQLWNASGDSGARLAGHDLYFTVGENIGTSSCSIPTAGLRWQPVRQPVVLDDWPVTTTDGPDRFTTVASWRGAYGPVAHDGVTMGPKAHEFRRFAPLPLRSPQTFEIALDIHPADARDLANLLEHGWQVVDPREHAGDPETFRQYVQTSSAECSVAQGVYVHTHSGWFSDRTVRYLASGKPALVQDTGFRDRYPVGEGLLAFSTLEEARDGAARIGRDYDGHSDAARAIAETWFDSDKVLSEFIDQTGMAA
jgi:hypothetical protein